MATATFALTQPLEGIPWTVTISNIDGADQVKDTTKYSNSAVSATTPNLGAIFNIDPITSVDNNKVNFYPGNYVTWRSIRLNLTYNQYPTTGFSFDVWNNTLYDEISGGAIWDDLHENTYTLNENKHSLIYNYDNYYAPIWSKGGVLEITIT